MSEWCITTTKGKFRLTDIAVMDFSVGNGVAEGSIEMFSDAHKVFQKWQDSGLTQDEYFGTDFFQKVGERD